MTDTPRTVPVVSIVGKGDSGKTTFMEKLIRELSGQGVRVATVKHHIHDYDIDVPGKDSWRHARAGAVTTMVSSPDKFSVISKVERELTLTDLARVAADSGADILLTEGFKREATVRIEVARRARSEELLSAPEELIAVVTDMPDLAPRGVSAFGLDESAAVAALIVDRYLRAGASGGAARSYAAGHPSTDAQRVCLSTTPPDAPADKSKAGS